MAVFLYGVQVSNVTAADQDKTIEGAKKEGALVVYTSMTVDQMQKILAAFKARYPFIQATMFRAVGERLLTKIMTEAQTGKYDFDVVQSAESQAYFLKKKNLLQKYISPETKNIQKPFFDPEGYWTAVYIMPNVIAYNTRMVKRNEVPKTDEDLLNPKWKGKIGMDHTKPEWFAWKLKQMGEERGLTYMKKLGGPGVSALRRALGDHQSAGGWGVSPRAEYLSAQCGRGQTQRSTGGLARPGPGLYQISAVGDRL